MLAPRSGGISSAPAASAAPAAPVPAGARAAGAPAGMRASASRTSASTRARLMGWGSVLSGGFIATSPSFDSSEEARVAGARGQLAVLHDPHLLQPELELRRRAQAQQLAQAGVVVER